MDEYGSVANSWLRRMFALSEERWINPAKLPNKSFGTKRGQLNETMALAVGLHFARYEILVFIDK